MNNWIRAKLYRALDLVLLGRGLPRTVNGQRFELTAPCWRAFPSDYEPETDAFFARALEPGMVVLDVGAHVGIHTLAFSRRVGPSGHVYAFEPAAGSARLLERHLALNGADNCTLLRSAVGASETTAEMEVNLDGPDPGNSVVSRGYVARKRRVTVPVVSLDGFCASRGIAPDFIKIDTEGFELEALRGARSLFASAKPPKVVCALHPWHLSQLGASEEAFFDACRELGVRTSALSGEPTGPMGEYREIVLEV